MVTEATIRDALGRVMDPEIPAVSIADLGMVARIAVTDDAVEVDLLPTFSGCPALDVIRDDAARAVERCAPDRTVRVRFVQSPAWTIDRLTDTGREAMRGFGVAAPVLVALGRPDDVACPYCGARGTELESAFGPTPCRTIRYCSSCRNPFEGFKAKR